MPSDETLERFIARVEENAHDVAIEEFYTENSSMQENQAPPRHGREAHLANERRVLALARSVQSSCVHPVFVSGDRVVIRWRFRFDWLDGTITEMEEVACQRWEGERIAEETFFYDPAQRVPRKPDTDGICLL
jgi:SnoaL-like domain